MQSVLEKSFMILVQGLCVRLISSGCGWKVSDHLFSLQIGEIGWNIRIDCYEIILPFSECPPCICFEHKKWSVEVCQQYVY